MILTIIIIKFIIIKILIIIIKNIYHYSIKKIIISNKAKNNIIENYF